MWGPGQRVPGPALITADHALSPLLTWPGSTDPLTLHHVMLCCLCALQVAARAPSFAMAGMTSTSTTTTIPAKKGAEGTVNIREAMEGP